LRSCHPKEWLTMSLSHSTAPEQSFHWDPQPRTAAFIDPFVQQAIASSDQIATLARDMADHTGTRLSDWVDHLQISAPQSFAEELTSAEYEQVLAADFPPHAELPAEHPEATLWQCRHGHFPRLIWIPGESAEPHVRDLCLRVESVEDFATAQNAAAPADAGPSRVMGVPGGWWRRVEWRGRDPGLSAVEPQHWPGCFSFSKTRIPARQLAAAHKHRQALADRPRDAFRQQEAITALADLLQAAIVDLSRNWTCGLFFAAERDYWLGRNTAAQVQHERQQRLGLGWGNHDHHTYRSSRACFRELVGVLELLGMQCRERFYAGEQAGWGAQVLEHPETGFVVFADVDMSPEELAGDFAHEGLTPGTQLGTVGLWCALHGESIAAAGMHHLECQFDFDAARDQLAQAGVETMAPFTDFSYLRQAFTVGQRWPVDRQRLSAAVAAGYLTESEATQFAHEGALGSHLEILERNDGYKGFNQTGVSDIILRTDPRRQVK
jgi:hypothetical protein